MRKEIMDEFTKYFGTKNNEDNKIEVILPY